MGESIGMNITIGGELPDSLVEEFLSVLKDDLSEITGPITRNHLRKETEDKAPIKWFAVTNYGECESLKAFCENHNLSYVHHCEAKYEYNASISYWVPGMKEAECIESNQDGDAQIDIEKVRPLVMLLLEYTKIGDKALPLFIGDEKVKTLVEKGLKQPKKFLPAIEKAIQTLLPGEPKIPPFVIKE